MVKFTNVDMSLDDLITKTRKTKSSIGKKPVGGRRPLDKKRSQGQPRRPYRDFDAPGQSDFPVISSSANKTVRVNISGLALTVIAEDLEELFSSYGLEKCIVNYDAHGQSVGTGDIHLKRRDAERLIKQFTGVALDGKVMKFALVDGNNMAGRVDFGAKRSFAGSSRGGPRGSGGPSGGRRPKSNPEDFLRDGVHEGKMNARGRGGKFGARKAVEKKPKKTEAELDAELDAYMSKRNA